ncbi:heat shock protein 70 family [Artemisia annua]|uniref:Heat shock protein 70 family n=1 Tax=Artemisia annua TaxID=35608 RepID=A0A2U1NUL5_ARTAN|nr:heat shock protein 70 family [Artemisia annua]
MSLSISLSMTASSPSPETALSSSLLLRQRFLRVLQCGWCDKLYSKGWLLVGITKNELDGNMMREMFNDIMLSGGSTMFLVNSSMRVTVNEPLERNCLSPNYMASDFQDTYISYSYFKFYLDTYDIECLMDDKDVRGFIKIDEIEQISIPVLERVKKPLEKALAEAKLKVDDIYAMKVVGSSSRVPAVIKILTEFFGKEPRCTMNTSECVSKGCALKCAILSPTFKIRDFQVQESFPIPISLTWKGAAQDSQL